MSRVEQGGVASIGDGYGIVELVVALIDVVGSDGGFAAVADAAGD